MIVIAVLAVAASVQRPAEPLAPDFREKIEAVQKEGMLDEVSARFKFGEPYKVLCKGKLFRSKLWSEAWVVPYQVNGRNSYGGYVGYENRWAAFLPTDAYNGGGFRLWFVEPMKGYCAPSAVVR